MKTNVSPALSRLAAIGVSLQVVVIVIIMMIEMIVIMIMPAVVTEAAADKDGPHKQCHHAKSRQQRGCRSLGRIHNRSFRQRIRY